MEDVVQGQRPSERKSEAARKKTERALLLGDPGYDTSCNTLWDTEDGGQWRSTSMATDIDDSGFRDRQRSTSTATDQGLQGTLSTASTGLTLESESIGPIATETIGPIKSTGPIFNESTGPIPDESTGPISDESTGPLRISI